jgi:hypothetical protein
VRISTWRTGDIAPPSENITASARSAVGSIFKRTEISFIVAAVFLHKRLLKTTDHERHASTSPVKRSGTGVVLQAVVR